MGSFGERLRREREMRGISIEEIAEATKIGSRNLRALEEEHFDQLPGGIFNKGFVRAYSKYLGLDEEQAVADYVAAESAFRESTTGQLDVPVENTRRSSKAFPAVIVLLIAIAAGGFFGWRYIKKKAMEIADRESPAVTAAVAKQNAPPAPTPATAVQQTPAETQPGTNPAQPDVSAATPPGAPSPTTAAAAAPETASADSSAAAGFVVLVRANQDSWVSAKADGKPVLSGTLKATSEKTLRARDRIVLTLGNAAGVQVSYNGKDQSFDHAAKVKTLVFTTQGLQPEVPEQRQ